MFKKLIEWWTKPVVTKKVAKVKRKIAPAPKIKRK